MATAAQRRLDGVSKHIAPPSYLVVVLPNDGRVTRTHIPDGPINVTRLALDGQTILEYAVVPEKSYAFDLSAFGTRFEGSTKHIPKYQLVQLNPPSNTGPSSCSIPDFWAAIYALWTIYHEQEYIPVSLSTLQNGQELAEYLLSSGLGRLYPSKIPRAQGPPRVHNLEEVYFLNRSAFWQGAGIEGYEGITGWIPNPRTVFPAVMSFTRQENIVAKHPLRPAKPFPGEIIYKRWCSAVGQALEFAYFDIDGLRDPPSHHAVSESGEKLSRHLAAFHRWHNEQRVNNAWGEQGTLEDHKAYLNQVLSDPHVVPCMFSWDGELTGYMEIVYTKEDHSAVYYPFGEVPGEWDRGIHVLIGEAKYLGAARSDIWIRSLTHYIFLSDPRTNRVLGEPDVTNKAIGRVADTAEYNRVIVFDFPYKRSVMVIHTREKFFTICRLR